MSVAVPSFSDWSEVWEKQAKQSRTLARRAEAERRSVASAERNRANRRRRVWDGTALFIKQAVTKRTLKQMSADEKISTHRVRSLLWAGRVYAPRDLGGCGHPWPYYRNDMEGEW